MGATVDVDELADGLYVAAPDEFVRVRGEGVKQLKAAGLTDEATAFGKLAKPSLPAWALNLLARERSDAVGEVVDRGAELRRAHTSGTGAAEILDAHRARQHAIAAAVDIAAELVDRPLSESHRAEVAASLEAASVDAAAAEALRRGRLVRPLDAPTGFEALGGLTVIPGGRTARAAPEPARRPTTRGAKRSRDAGADEQVETRRAAADAARGEAQAARQAATDLRGRVGELEERQQRLVADLRAVEQRLVAARREARDADRAATEAERRATRAAARAER